VREPITYRRPKPPTCELCGAQFETVATAQNPSAKIAANSLVRCPSCMTMWVVGVDLRLSPDLSYDEASPPPKRIAATAGQTSQTSI
jgi:hypothetical protein